MKTAALAVLALLGALAAPLGGAAGAGEQAADLDASMAYAAGGAGALTSLAGAPAFGADAAPPAASAAQLQPLSFEQGRAMRPAGLAMSWWAGDAALWLDAQRAAAEDDAALFAAVWQAWSGLPGATLPTVRDAALLPAGARALQGPDVELRTQPSPDLLTNEDDALTITATIAPASPGGSIREARAFLRTGAGVRALPLQEQGDAWMGTFDGPLAAGPHSLWVEATDDQLGVPPGGVDFVEGFWFLGGGRSAALDLDVRDALAPVVHLTGPAFINESAVTLAAAMQDETGIVAARIVPGAWAAPQDTYEVAIQEDGVATFTLEARDAAGNVGSAAFQLTRDTAAPDAIVEGTPEGWSRTPVALAVAAGPSLAPSEVAFTVDGTDPHDATFGPGANPVVTTEGTTVLRAVARDAAGNVGQPAERTIRIDSVEPVLDTAPSLDGPGWRTTPLHVSIHGTDAGSGIAEVQARLVDASGSESDVDPAGFDVPEGVHVLHATARDAAGHSADLSRTIRVDTEPPTTTLTAEGNGGDVMLHWTATDATSGIGAVRVEVRVPGSAWLPLLVNAPASGSLAYQVARGAEREVRAIATDAAGQTEAKEGADLLVSGGSLPPPPSSTGGGGSTSSGTGSGAGPGTGGDASGSAGTGQQATGAVADAAQGAREQRSRDRGAREDDRDPAAAAHPQGSSDSAAQAGQARSDDASSSEPSVSIVDISPRASEPAAVAAKVEVAAEGNDQSSGEASDDAPPLPDPREVPGAGLMLLVLAGAAAAFLRRGPRQP
jgi:hypothetical protein